MNILQNLVWSMDDMHEKIDTFNRRMKLYEVAFFKMGILRWIIFMGLDAEWIQHREKSMKLKDTAKVVLVRKF